MWLTEEQQQIWRGYLTMVNRLQTAMHRQLQQDCELSLSDYDVLVALSESGSQRINELGEVLVWEQSRLSPTADARPWMPPHRGTSSWCAPWCSTN
jgi:hypothetical protein